MNRFASFGVSPFSQGGSPHRDSLSQAARRRRRRRIARSLALVLGMTTSVLAVAWWRWQATDLPTYEGSFQLLMKPETPVSGLLGFGENLHEISPQTPWDLPTQVALLKSPKRLSPLMAPLQTRYPDLRDWQSALTIERLKDTQIVEVRYRSRDPEQVLALLETLAQGYLHDSRQSQQTQLHRPLEYIDTQLQQLQAQRSQQQAQIEQFRAQSGLDPQIQGQQMLHRLGKLQEQRSTTQIQWQQAKALYTRLQQELKLKPEMAIAAAALSQSPRYQALRHRLQEVESNIAQELTRFREGTPPIQVLRHEQQNLKDLLQQEAEQILGTPLAKTLSNWQALGEPNSVRLELMGQLVEAANQTQVLGVQLEALEQEIQSLEDQQQQLSALLPEYANLQQALQQTIQQLEQLAKQKATLEFSAIAQPALPWEIVAEPAIKRTETNEPIPLRTFPLPVALAGLLGMGLSIAMAMALQRLDGRFQHPEDLPVWTQLPLLAKVPETRFEAANRGSTGFQFACVTLWHSLNEAMEGPLASVVVSSPNLGEGKSTIALHLALAAACEGKRVLLVDGNLRHPTLHRSLSLPNRQGLSDAIVSDFNFNASIERSPWEENLFVLTAGSPHPDPSLLMASAKMKEVAAQLGDSFDCVIYDAPPLLKGSEARLLGALADGIAIVANWHRTQRTAALQALAPLQVAGIPVLGVVLNGVTESEAIAYSAVRLPTLRPETPTDRKIRAIERQQS